MSGSRTPQQYCDIAEQQGWRVRETKTGFQIIPPKGEIIQIAPRFGGNHDEANARARLVRAGLNLPNFRPTHTEKLMPVESRTGSLTAVPPQVHIVPTPASAPKRLLSISVDLEGDPLVVIHTLIDIQTDIASEMEKQLGRANTRASKLEKLHEALKDLGT